LLTGKRKEQIREEDKEVGREDDEDIFVDSSPTMDTDDNTVTSVTNNQECGGNNTNSLVVYEEHQTPLK
jgi:hypothetical protein